MRKPSQMISELSGSLPLFMVNAFMYIAMAAYGPYMSAYYSDQLGMSSAQIGLLFGAGPIVAMLIQPVWALVSDRTGRRRNVLALLCLLSASAILLFYAANSFAGYLMAAICLSAFTSSVMPLGDSVLILRAKEKNVPFSHIRAAGTIGYATVVYFFGLIYKSHANYMFAVAAAMYALLALMVFRLPDDGSKAQQVAEDQAADAPPFRFRGEFVILALFAFVCHTGFNFSNSFLGAYTVELGLDRSALGSMNALAALCELPTLIGIHWLLKRFGTIPMIVCAGLLLSARIFMVSTGQLGWIFFGQMIQSSGFIILYCCCAMYIGANVPRAYQSIAQTCYAILQSGLSNLGGYMFGGWLSGVVGIPMAYRGYGYFSLIGTLGLMVVYLLFARYRKAKGQPVQF